MAIEIYTAAKSDYAANVGAGAAVEFPHQWPGPKSLEEGDDPKFLWPETEGFKWPDEKEVVFDGVI